MMPEDALDPRTVAVLVRSLTEDEAAELFAATRPDTAAADPLAYMQRVSAWLREREARKRVS